MKKATLLAVVALVSVSFGSLVMAAPVKDMLPNHGGYHKNLTEDQKAEWQQLKLEQKKQMLQKQVEWGYLTQEQADQRITAIQEQQANGYSHNGHSSKRMHGEDKDHAAGDGCKW